VEAGHIFESPNQRLQFSSFSSCFTHDFFVMLERCSVKCSLVREKLRWFDFGSP
jgi:hypothetical protein